MKNFSSLLAAAFAILLTCSPLVVRGAGLGEISVRSALGQPLRADIDLVAVDRDELDSLRARGASSEAYARSNLEYAPLVQGIRMTIAKRSDGRPYVQLRSSAPIDEPFVNLVVELTSATGNLVRAYTFLLDPIATTRESIEPPSASTPNATAVAPTKRVEAPRASPLTRETAVTTTAAATATDTGTSHVVQPGDTLSKIANAYRHTDLSMQQMTLALFRANEQSFIDRDVNRLIAGRTLRIPTVAEVRAVDRDEARALLTPSAERAVAQSRPIEADKLVLMAPPPAKPDPAAQAEQQLVERSRQRVFHLESRMDELVQTLKLANERIALLQRELSAASAAHRAHTAQAEPRRIEASNSTGIPTVAPSIEAASQDQQPLAAAGERPKAGAAVPRLSPEPSRLAADPSGLDAGAPRLAAGPPRLAAGSTSSSRDVSAPASEDERVLETNIVERSRFVSGWMLALACAVLALGGFLALRRFGVFAGADNDFHPRESIDELLNQRAIAAVPSEKESHWQPLANDVTGGSIVSEVDLNVGESIPAAVVDARIDASSATAGEASAAPSKEASGSILSSWSTRLLSARRAASASSAKR